MTSSRPITQCKSVCFNPERIAALKAQLPSERHLRETARRHKILGHPARQAILYALDIEECCVCDIAGILDKPISTVSQHLRTLESEGLLTCRQEGKLVFYSLLRDGNGEYDPETRLEAAIR